MISYLIRLALILVVLLVACNFAIAGTTQIFSPAGLPQSSTQNYVAPTPGNIPTQSFPTPPLPLGGGVMQSITASPLPLNTGQTSSASPDTSGQPLAAPATGSIESFFQCQSLTRDKSIAPATASSIIKPGKAVVGDAGKVIWHTLDNLGVPMFMNKDSDLDPSLSRTYMMPPQTVPAKTIAPPIPQKIPESELEGTEVSPKNDQQVLPLH